MSAYHSSWIERNNYYEPVSNPADDLPSYRDYRRPVIVCLCGSSRFAEAYRQANYEETLAGKIVLSIGCNGHDQPLTEEQKVALDWLHKRKIDLADEVLVLNCGGYVGDSTRSELDYAMRQGKAIRWLEPQEEPKPC